MTGPGAFDFNDLLERKMAAYAKYMVNDGRWEGQANLINERSGGNSLKKKLNIYMRMLVECRRVRSRRQSSLGRDYLLPH